MNPRIIQKIVKAAGVASGELVLIHFWGEDEQKEIAAYFQAQKPENRVVCELGFGMNPNVRDLCGYRVLDEKMADTFHIAVGANHMFGGANQANNHIDFVGTAYTLLKE